MIRTVTLPGPGSTSTPLRFSHRAARRIEDELKANINTIFKRLGNYGDDEKWGELAAQVAAIGIDAAREPSARATPLTADAVADILDAAVDHVGREGVAEILRDGIWKGASKTGERQPDAAPKGTTAPTA